MYECLYTPVSADSGNFDFRVGTNTTDTDSNALAPAYTHTAKILIDNTAPTVSFSPGNGGYTNNASATITLTFSEPVFANDSATAFTNSGAAGIVTLKRTSATGPNISFSAAVTTSGSDANKKITLTPSSNLSEGKVYVAVSNAHYDAAGNQGTASNATFTVDTTAPTVVTASTGYYSDAAGTKAVTKVKKGDSVYIKITFSEDMGIGADGGPNPFAMRFRHSNGNWAVTQTWFIWHSTRRTSTHCWSASSTATNVIICQAIADDPSFGTSGDVEFRIYDDEGMVTDLAGNTLADAVSGDTDYYHHGTYLAVDGAAPTVTSGAYYSDSAAATPLSGTVSGGGDEIYTKLVFSEDLEHVAGSGANLASARPKIDYRIGGSSGTSTQYSILASTATLASGQCKPTSASATTTYLCRYTTKKADHGDFDTVVGTATTDEVGNALASAYTPSGTLTLKTPGLVASATSLTVGEGSSNTFTVKLNSQPTADVTVTLSGSGDVTIADTDANTPNVQNTLTFTNSTWNTAQTVTVNAAEDNDTTDDSATVTLNPSSTDTDYNGLADDTLAVTVDDNDDPGLTLSASTLTVTEGSTDTFTVQLDTQPTADVTVRLTSDNTDVTIADTDADTPGIQDSLTFTTTTWNTAQTVTVAAAQDGDTTDDSATVTLNPSSTDTGYNALANSTVAVTVDDNDTAGLTLSASTLTVTEGSTNSFTVRLGSQPTASVTVTLSGDGDVTVADSDTNMPGTQNTLTFTTTTWNTAQTVTVAAAEDADTTDDTATVTLDPSSTDTVYNGLANATVTVTVTDNDTPTAGLTLSASTLTVTEGSTNTFTVRLATQPTADVTVTLSGAGDVTIADTDANTPGVQNTLTFTNSTWNTAQTVTVNAAEDDDTTDDTVTVTLDPSSTDTLYNGLANTTVAVTVDDNDADVTAPTVAFQPADGATVTDAYSDIWLTFDEKVYSDASATAFTNATAMSIVTLTRDSASGAAIPFRLRVGAGETTHRRFSLEASSPSVDGRAPFADGPVHVAIGNGFYDADGNQGAAASATFTVEAAAPTVTAAAVDGDTLTLTFSEAMKAASKPAASVFAVDVAGATNPAVQSYTLSGRMAVLTLSAGVAHGATVTLGYTQPTGANATVLEDAAGKDLANFSGRSVTNSTSVAGLTVSASSLSATEGGTASFTVRLATVPTGTVTVATTSDNADVTLSSASLTFDVGTWATEQTVTVTAGGDGDAVDDTATLTLDPSGGGYDSVSFAAVSVTVTDDDTVALNVSESALSLTEGATGTFTVALDSEPSATVTVSLASDSGDVTLSDSSLTFTTTDYATAQTVTVTAAEDDDAVADTATVTLDPSGGGYGDVANSTVAVSADDNDTVGVNVSASTLALTEGATGTFDVSLDSKPTSAVTVTLTSDNADVTLSAATLRFTTGDWNTAQTVTATAAEDSDTANDTATITLDPAGGGYDAATDGTVAVTVTDNDAPGMTVSASALTLAEGGSGTFTVVLVAQPSGDVTVTLTSDSDDVTFDDSSLTFTSSTWQTEQTVTASAAEDANATDDTVTVTIDPSGGGYDDLASATIAVTMTDNDSVGMTVSLSSLAVTEGATGETFTVVLDVQPSADVTVALTSGSAVTLSPASLTFTTSTWNTAQTITVTAADDDDALEELATVTINPSGGGYDGVLSSTVTVTVDDDETDNTAPTVAFMPADESVTRESWGDLWLTFDELTYSDASATPFTDDTAAALVTLTQTDADGEAIAFTAHAHLTGETARRRITITPTEKPLPDGVIHVAVGTGYYDSEGNQGAAVSASFTVDTVGPTVMAFGPADGATTSEVYNSISVIFDDPVFGPNGEEFDADTAAGLITLREFGASGSDIPFTASAVVSGDWAHRRIYVKPDEALSEIDVYVGVGDGYYDAAGNQGAAASATFRVDTRPPALSAADASATEAAGAKLAFMVLLHRPVVAADGTVSVDYATRDGTATAGADYTAASGTLTFAAGEQYKTVNVTVLEDSHDDGGETLELVLSNAVGATIADGTGTGTIHNSDPMPQAWLARFGRTVAEQVLDGVRERREAARAPGEEVVTLAGQPWALSGEPASPEAEGGLSQWQGQVRTTGWLDRTAGQRLGESGWRNLDRWGTADPYGNSLDDSHTLTAREALLGTSFALTGGEDGAGGTLAWWGRVAASGFDGRKGTLTLDGEVTTGLIGADYGREDWLTGLVVSQTDADGSYTDDSAGSGTLASTLTAVTVYGAMETSARTELWGAAGHGQGELTLTPSTDSRAKSDLDWTMAAAGARSTLAEPGEGDGLMLALVTDALWARTTSDAAKVGSLAAAEADVTRLRLGVEGSWSAALEGGGSMTPALELGLRHDGGDAETGFGVELGGGLAWSVPASGLSLDFSGRTLLAHESEDFEDWGVSAGLAFDPSPGSARGLSLTLRHERGGAATGGLDALFAPEALDRRTGVEATGAWTVEAAWGFPAFGGRYTGSPHAGLGLAESARDYTVGWRLVPAAAAAGVAGSLSLDLTATRRESEDAAPEHRVGIEASLHW